MIIEEISYLINNKDAFLKKWSEIDISESKHIMYIQYLYENHFEEDILINKEVIDIQEALIQFIYHCVVNDYFFSSEDFDLEHRFELLKANYFDDYIPVIVSVDKFFSSLDLMTSSLSELDEREMNFRNGAFSEVREVCCLKKNWNDSTYLIKCKEGFVFYMLTNPE